ncbi:MAG: PAS domain S-box protein [Lentisphaerae bacterium]|nr:PAS domain S-box protein [Lentisphaerota bacterium]
MRPWTAKRRTVVDMAIALAAAFVLAVLNIAINFLDRIHAFLTSYSRFALTDALINMLFVWLAGLLWIAYLRWRATARKQAELEEIVSSISPDTLVVVTPDRRIRLCNASITRIFGYASDEVVGRTTDMLYRDRREKPGQNREIYETLKQEGFHVGLATGVTKSGREVPLEIITGHLSGGEGAVLLLRDISERVNAEQERLRLEERMQRQQKMESLGILAGGVAHDFNNLLTVVLGNADLIMQDLTPGASAREHVESIRKAARQATELCSQMLAYSGQGEYRVEPVDLAGVVRGMGRLLEVPLPKGARVELRLGTGLPRIEGDTIQIQQVLMNLVTNAAEAMPAADGLVTVVVDAVECDQAAVDRMGIAPELRPGRFVVLDVSDNGGGMDAETRARMFDPFFTTKFMGRGLGLASVLGIVRGHGGGIEVSSTPGKGSTFRIYFPAGR